MVLTDEMRDIVMMAVCLASGSGGTLPMAQLLGFSVSYLLLPVSRVLARAGACSLCFQGSGRLQT